MPGVRRARLELDDIYQLLAAASPEVLPLLGVTSLWLWNLAEDRHAAAHCVDGCLTLHYALAEYEIQSRVEAVAICIEDTRSGAAPGAMYGQNPHYNDDGTFNGHTVLVVTGAGRLIDPTIQQFAEVPNSKQAMLPVIGRLPGLGALEQHPVAVPRENHTVLYVPLPELQRQAWRGAVALSRDADFRTAGANLAANVLALLQLEGIRDKAIKGPYPRLRRLLAAIHGMDSVADRRGYRFADPATGREMSLSDVD